MSAQWPEFTDLPGLCPRCGGRTVQDDDEERGVWCVQFECSWRTDPPWLTERGSIALPGGERREVPAAFTGEVLMLSQGVSTDSSPTLVKRIRITHAKTGRFLQVGRVRDFIETVLDRDRSPARDPGSVDLELDRHSGTSTRDRRPHDRRDHGGAGARATCRVQVHVQRRGARLLSCRSVRDAWTARRTACSAQGVGMPNEIALAQPDGFRVVRFAYYQLRKGNAWDRGGSGVDGQVTHIEYKGYDCYVREVVIPPGGSSFNVGAGARQAEKRGGKAIGIEALELAAPASVANDLASLIASEDHKGRLVMYSKRFDQEWGRRFFRGDAQRRDRPTTPTFFVCDQRDRSKSPVNRLYG